LSVEAVQESAIWLLDEDIALRFVGVDGAIVSGAVTVTVTDALTEPAEFVAVRV
jgi:hypothetical protein